jgi:hypothetical protein
VKFGHKNQEECTRLEIHDYTEKWLAAIFTECEKSDYRLPKCVVQVIPRKAVV